MALLALGDKHTFIEAFHVLLDGKAYNIPEPDPVLIHFDRAYFLLKQITTTRAGLIEKLGTGLLNEEISKELYSHFGCCLDFITCLFTSIEAQMNRLIPADYNYMEERKNCSMVYNAQQIHQ